MLDKNFTVYKSSAGSGKTFTLVKEYLALALNDAANPPQAYKHILAITFTNKAAAEMKERIIKALTELSVDDYSKLSKGTQTLLSILKQHPKLNSSTPLDDTTIRIRAKNVLTAILHSYSDFAIGTIDSFVHKVVKTFAFDLKLPMSFDIEMDDNKLLSQTIDLLINKTGSDELLTKVLVEFTESKTDDEKSWHIESDLLLFAKNLLTEDGYVHIGKLKDLTLNDFFKIKSSLRAELQKFEKSIIAESEKAIDIIKKAGLTVKDFSQTNSGIYGYFDKTSKGRMDYLEPNSHVVKTIYEDKWAAGKTSKETITQVDSIKAELSDLFFAIQKIKEKGYSNYTLLQLINRNIYSLAVLNEIEKLLNEYKSENNIIHISEFNKMIAKIVLNEPIPFIYERLGERYNNYLIDEFQDTSVLQFQNLLPLIDNALASGNFTMLVGDGKQAIYRFRGGEVEQFAQLPKVFAHNDNKLVLEREAALERSFNPQFLKNNFRSKREIIEFNNSFFKSIALKLNEKYQSIYHDLEQGFNPENTGGFVHIEFTDKNKEDFQLHNKQKTLETIHQLLTENYSLKDIAVLVRKNSDGSEIANYLTEHGIDVISSDSLLLNKSQEVHFIHSILSYLSNNENDIVHVEILEYLIHKNYLSTKNISELIIEKNKIGMNRFLISIVPEFNYTKLSKIPVYELCEEIIRIFKLNQTPNAYIQFYLDEVLNFSIKKNININDFIEHWNDKKDKISLIVPDGINAVRIMTIHRSKGLEFPVVILPFLESKIENGKKHTWINIDNGNFSNLPSVIVPMSKELEKTAYASIYEEEKNKSLLDYFNVLYVALTRPEERLYIFTGKYSESANLTTVSSIFSSYFCTQKSSDNLIFTYGTATKHIEHKSFVKLNTYQLNSFNSNQWRNQIKMRSASKSIWNTQFAETKKDYGVMIHTALSRIQYVDDIQQASKSMLAEGLISTDDKLHIDEVIQKLVNNSQLSNYFKEGLIVKNEAEIITKEGKMYRPDRVVINDKIAVIIDYKTGEEKKEHKIQITEYGDLLHEMGYTVTERLLVYIKNEKIIAC